MSSLLIHGVYESKTLGTLKDKGINEISFDLRGRSSNLVTFSNLSDLLKAHSQPEVFLTFGDDKRETVVSYLNLLKDQSVKFKLIFRDNQSAEFYRQIPAPFYWMYSPEGDWKGILKNPNCIGVILPLKFETYYQKSPEMWALIDEQHLDVYLHAETFEETAFIKNLSEIKLSIDLSPEVEISYRHIDQEKLQGLRIWRRLNENTYL